MQIALLRKNEFYCLAERMSRIIKDIITEFDEHVLVDKVFCENEKMFADWVDLSKYELFREVSELFKSKQYYEISLPEDDKIIDLIVESNFRYFTYISLYLPKTKLIILPTCHTEILVYSDCSDKIVEVLEPIVAKHSDDKYKIMCKRYGTVSVHNENT